MNCLMLTDEAVQPNVRQLGILLRVDSNGIIDGNENK